MEELLQRINTLAHKQKTMGLTEAEQQEQAELRKKYLAEFRARFRDQLEHTVIVDAEGNRRKLQRKRG